MNYHGLHDNRTNSVSCDYNVHIVVQESPVIKDCSDHESVLSFYGLSDCESVLYPSVSWAQETIGTHIDTNG